MAIVILLIFETGTDQTKDQPIVNEDYNLLITRGRERWEQTGVIFLNLSLSY